MDLMQLVRIETQLNEKGVLGSLPPHLLVTSFSNQSIFMLFMDEVQILKQAALEIEKLEGNE